MSQATNGSDTFTTTESRVTIKEEEIANDVCFIIEDSNDDIIARVYSVKVEGIHMSVIGETQFSDISVTIKTPVIGEENVDAMKATIAKQ